MHIDGEEVAVLIGEAQANEAPVAQTSWSRGKHANLFAEFKKSDEADKRITHINDNPELYAWKANPCLLQDHHPQYDHSACSDEEQVPEAQESALPDRVSKQTLAQAMNDLADETKEKEKKDGEAGAQKPKKKKRDPIKNERSGKQTFGEKTEEFRAAI